MNTQYPVNIKRGENWKLTFMPTEGTLPTAYPPCCGMSYEVVLRDDLSYLTDKSIETFLSQLHL